VPPSHSTSLGHKVMSAMGGNQTVATRVLLGFYRNRRTVGNTSP
jgi:hypothetical protein